MQEFPDIPNNSFRYASQNKRTEVKDYSVLPKGTESVTASKEKRRGKFLTWVLQAPDDVPDIETYFKRQGVTILQNIIFPKIRDILMDSLSSILNISSKPTQGSIGSISRVSYDSKYKNVGSNNIRPLNNNPQERAFYEDIGFYDPNIAEKFMKKVEDLYYDQEGYITVAQFYDIASRPTTPEQSNYGWTSLNSMKIVYSKGGIYYINMSDPIPLN